MPVRAPWTERLYQLLADGQWHDQRAMVDACAGLVPPGVAHREGEAGRRRHQAERTGNITARVHGDTAAGIRHGANNKVRDSIQRQVELGHLERRYKAGRPQIRAHRNTSRRAS